MENMLALLETLFKFFKDLQCTTKLLYNEQKCFLVSSLWDSFFKTKFILQLFLNKV